MISCGKWAIEQRTQQHADVAAVDVGIGHDHHLAVAQVVEHRRRRVGRVRVDAERDRDVVHLAVGEQAAGLDLPGVEHLAAQRKNRLQLFIAAGFGRAARRVAFDQEQFVCARHPRSGSRRACRAGWQRPGLLALLDLLAGARTRLRGADRQLSDLLGVVGVFVEPQFQGGREPIRATSATASRELRRSLVWPGKTGRERAPRARSWHAKRRPRRRA